MAIEKMSASADSRFCGVLIGRQSCGSCVATKIICLCWIVFFWTLFGLRVFLARKII